MRHDPIDDFYEHKNRHEPEVFVVDEQQRRRESRAGYERSSPDRPSMQKDRSRRHESGGGGRRHEKMMMEKHDYDPSSMARNPYKEADSLPYRESIEKMIKSPVMRYKSFEDEADSNSYSEDDEDGPKGSQLKKYLVHEDGPSSSVARLPYKSMVPKTPMAAYESGSGHTARRYADEKISNKPQPPLPYHSDGAGSISKHSPKDRFQDAKQKFQAMELDRSTAASEKRRSQPQQQVVAGRQMSYDLSKDHHHQRQHSGGGGGGEWTFDEADSSLQHNKRDYRHHHHDGQMMMTTDRYDHHHGKMEAQQQRGGMVLGGGGGGGAPKSLGNLVKGGYRHSYAEPQPNNPPLPRNSGRVGLAAVNPF